MEGIPSPECLGFDWLSSLGSPGCAGYLGVSQAIHQAYVALMSALTTVISHVAIPLQKNRNEQSNWKIQWSTPSVCAENFLVLILNLFCFVHI